MIADEIFELLDWKRRIFALYAEVRANNEPEDAWHAWRRTRDALFRDHPQSPIPQDEREAFASLPFFPYDPALRVSAEVRAASRERFEIGTSGTDPMAFTRFATADLHIGHRDITLDLFWLDAYGGGLFLPFRDATSGTDTYGAGRYLLDTVKGADLGMEEDRLVVDFNFAYNPSCAYDPRWVCPLAPPANRIEIPITAGERTGH